MAEDTGQERTEQATDKRMKEVREKGQLSKSTDMTAWLGVGAAAVMLPSTIGRASSAATDQLFTVRSIIEDPDPSRAVEALGAGLGSIPATLGPMMAVVVVAVLLGAAVQGGIRFKKFKGKFEQFNLVTGMKNTFGKQALWNGAKAFMKTGVVGLVLYIVVQGLVPVLMSAGGLPVDVLVSTAGGGVVQLLQYAIAAGILLAIADVFVVMKRNRKKTRMTKKEVKDENKNTDGDPLIKSQRRARQMAMSRNRMIAAVGDADVVLVNPTHYAVALKYEPGKSAPRVVAKGADHVATKIREKAGESAVPMVSDIPLTRALHSACEIGHEIPAEFYGAVAGVLAFVMRLKQRGAATGMHTAAAAGTNGSFLADAAAGTGPPA